MNKQHPIVPAVKTVTVAPGVRVITLGALRAVLRHAVMMQRRQQVSRRVNYTDAACTDIVKTFDRIRWERARAGQEPRRVKLGVILVDFVGLALTRRRSA